MSEVEEAVAAVIRRSWARLIAVLAAPTRDLALAEDALGSAVERALAVWPETGIPRSPEGWLLTVARHRVTDVLRSAARRTAVPLEEASAVAAPDEAPGAFPDRRLALLFVCAHPAIDPGIRTPLMLQVVLGVDARAVASAFAVPPAGMAQRLVRAKRRIRDAGIAFEVPDRGRWVERLPPVLEAVYGAYAIGRSGPADLRAEGRHLALLLAELIPDEPEVLGLAALITLAGSRDAVASGFVPLEHQDPASWDRDLLVEGEALLRRAAAYGRPGRFQLEAAIQSAHMVRAFGGAVDREAVRRLYAALVRVAPTLGARVAHAVATARLDGAEAGLRLLAAIPDADGFQPLWVARAALLAEAGRLVEAETARMRALALTADPADREHLAAGVPRL